MTDPHRRRRLAGGLALAVLLPALAGCLDYDARILVDPDGGVEVRERIVLQPGWKEAVGDTVDAARRVVRRYAVEAKERGGKVEEFGTDSAKAVFRFPSLAAFADGWPDDSDNGLPWDRSVYRRLESETGPLEELVLFRMSPPSEERRLPNQRFPVLTFAVVPPRLPVEHNAHVVSGETYWWRFTERMEAPDSVRIVWPAAPTP